MDTTPQKAGQVIALIENGLSQRAVARQLDMTRAAVRKVCKRYEEAGFFHRRAGTCRGRFTTIRDDRFIVSTTLRNRHLKAVQVQRQLRELRGMRPEYAAMVATEEGKCTEDQESDLQILYDLGGDRVHRRGGLTAVRYIEEILAIHVVPYVDYIGDEFTFMHDNARPHTARIVQYYITEVGFRVMEWPVYRPDLNPIEHLWNELKRRIRARLDHTPNSISELIVAAEKEYFNIPQETIANLIRSMPNRMREVIRERDSDTHY
ncbi:hypothetical protein D910_06037 [Dendroctonus ponderosae]|uniref:Uncharacterized protein n=1 Tax=Dendroctonus ponderosae TaxID=77166 RepID=U4U8G8_DENPD|nr:hypothetical protein D910_06037 [Dendroctonus ponderosae]